RVGVLMYLAADDAEAQARLAAFVRGLQQLGWTEGRNVRIDRRWGAGDADRARKYAAELVALGPDVALLSRRALELLVGSQRRARPRWRRSLGFGGGATVRGDTEPSTEGGGSQTKGSRNVLYSARAWRRAMADVAHDASGPASPKPGDIAPQQATRPDSPDRGKLHVFISYSREDLYFADQLNAALDASGFECFIDRHSISGGEDWKRRLGNL